MKKIALFHKQIYTRCSFRFFLHLFLVFDRCQKMCRKNLSRTLTRLTVNCSLCTNSRILIFLNPVFYVHSLQFFLLQIKKFNFIVHSCTIIFANFQKYGVEIEMDFERVAVICLLKVSEIVSIYISQLTDFFLHFNQPNNKLKKKKSTLSYDRQLIRCNHLK